MTYDTRSTRINIKRIAAAALVAAGLSATPAAADSGEGWQPETFEECTGGVPAVMCSTEATADGRRLHAAATLDTGAGGQAPYVTGDLRALATASAQTSRDLPAGRWRWTFEVKVDAIAWHSSGTNPGGGAGASVRVTPPGRASRWEDAQAVPWTPGRHRVAVVIDQPVAGRAEAVVIAGAGASGYGYIGYHTNDACPPEPFWPIPRIVWDLVYWVWGDCVKVPATSLPWVVAARGTAGGHIEAEVVGVEVEAA